ncbi:hypothetical protein BB560_006401 [Smittium megazygosporum]|uniref:Uncharacterized protein n=1 Tax=Smittium megazygosporum TaxID=133381 RepID=A0A2T9Y6W1_9FUNG|nr:hypothetical protein BB560_006401 [Smittium megazygosporum]
MRLDFLTNDEETEPQEPIWKYTEEKEKNNTAQIGIKIGHQNPLLTRTVDIKRATAAKTTNDYRSHKWAAHF